MLAKANEMKLLQNGRLMLLTVLKNIEIIY